MTATSYALLLSVSTTVAAAYTVHTQQLPRTAYTPTHATPHTRSNRLTLSTPTETMDFTSGSVRPQVEAYDEQMRPRPSIEWANLRYRLSIEFKLSDDELAKYDHVDKTDLVKAYEMMQLSRQFENACNQAYMQGSIRGFMHLDNGQETIPALMADALKPGDKKIAYYREHTQALASGVSADAVMAELWAKDGGSCRGCGGSMHIYDRATNFQGGWALISEQLPYGAGAARSILLDRHLDPEGTASDDRIAVVLAGDGASQNGRMAETLNAAAKESLPLLFIVIDNGRAINTFTPDVAANSDVFAQGMHYGIPGIKVDGGNLLDTLRTGRAVIDYVRSGKPAILQVHTYRFQGHSPADPEHERGRKTEKVWARAEADPIKLFQSSEAAAGMADELDAATKAAKEVVKASLAFAKASPEPPASLAKELEFPDSPDTDYNARAPPADAEGITARTVDAGSLAECQRYMDGLRELAEAGTISIADACSLAVLEEMVRDPTTVMHAEDLQAGSSYNIPKLTQQTFGKLRAADEIIDEGHFIGKALGEGMNGYRPIVEMMNTNFAIFGMAEISSAGNTYATTGGHFKMPMTILGAGGTAPNQALGPTHSQPFHAYIMGVPGIKIGTAASPQAAYSITKAMIRDDGPCFLFMPVKMMKETKGHLELGRCAQLNQCALLHQASADAVAKRKAVTVLTYLHGVKEAELALQELLDEGMDVDLIELRSLKPLDMDTIRASLERTHMVAILDESTNSGGVGATVSALINEQCFDLLDAPVKRLCMDDAPVPYASSMEKAVVKRGSDLVQAVFELTHKMV